MNLTKAYDLDKTERFDSDANGVKFWFEAKVNLVTPAFRQSLIDASGKPEKFAAEMSKLITDWDVFLAADGDLVPKDADFATKLTYVPEKFLWHVFNTIAESWSGDAKKQEASQSGSEV